MNPMVMLLSFVCACAITLMASPASAANELCLSASSGGSCSDPLMRSLTSPDFRWVPGDSEQTSFWARNMSGDHALLDIDVIGDEGDPETLTTGELVVEVKVGNGTWQGTNRTGRQALVQDMPVDPHETLQVFVRATFPYGATVQNQSQVQRLGLQFEARLRYAADGPGNGGGDKGGKNDKKHGKRDRNGILPGTGGPVWWLLPAGLLGVSTGWFTVAASKRREKTSDV